MQSIHDVVPAAVRSLLAKAPLSQGKVHFAWRAAVGSVLDRASAVELRDDGVMLVNVKDSYWQRELLRSREVVLRRLKALLGSEVVRDLEVRVQESRKP